MIFLYIEWILYRLRGKIDANPYTGIQITHESAKFGKWCESASPRIAIREQLYSYSKANLSMVWLSKEYSSIPSLFKVCLFEVYSSIIPQPL